MEQYFLNAVPDNAPYEHDYEGPDDMPSHIKSSMLGVSLMLPVEDGRVRLGTGRHWEHRIHGGSRRIVATLMGNKDDNFGLLQYCMAKPGAEQSVTTTGKPRRLRSPDVLLPW